jgi:hypothetical protein
MSSMPSASDIPKAAPPKPAPLCSVAVAGLASVLFKIISLLK